MTFTLKHGNNVSNFKGFQNYTGKKPNMLVVMQDGESDLYDWDGSQEGITELIRYYKLLTGSLKAVKPLRYTEII